MCQAGLIRGMQSGIDWKKTTLQRTKNKENISQPYSVTEDLPPKKSSPPNGGPTRLGIGRRTSTRKRSVASGGGRGRSRSKVFSTKR